MAHIRTQVRDAVEAALKGLPSTEDRCFVTRTFPLDHKRLPALLVYVLDEQSQPAEMGADRDIERQMSVTVEATADGKGFDDELDQIAVEVETALAGSGFLGGLVKELYLQSTNLDIAVRRDRGEKRQGILTLRYMALAIAPENDPETAH
ncbi:hypothetical protein PsAD46_03539 [Pseudovibrio sp. Ad46]|uniref:hypothetical protein n=1 Tax=unclassified Pseudovibrio TaxID=2627060 RepID=UPI0007AE70FA|nr:MULTISPECIES: hypothetical protein [unclassified Pseudovibrio]KZK82411.1 hypothetical protein PsAD46_03539 [Pseudovibrio sp. Ad46]KZK96441.1 hypothetical protein PsAD5_02634 [Pseudovibrio sp. Ad5]